MILYPGSSEFENLKFKSTWKLELGFATKLSSQQLKPILGNQKYFGCYIEDIRRNHPDLSDQINLSLSFIFQKQKGIQLTLDHIEFVL